MVAARCNRRDGSQSGRLALASLGGRAPARDESGGPIQNSKIVTFQRCAAGIAPAATEGVEPVGVQACFCTKKPGAAQLVLNRRSADACSVHASQTQGT